MIPIALLEKKTINLYFTFVTFCDYLRPHHDKDHRPLSALKSAQYNVHFQLPTLIILFHPDMRIMHESVFRSHQSSQIHRLLA